ncbi:MAG: class I SAM-dependent methyltransferase [Anaerolineae bacterium]|nr:class I SAM-dependent methyltransferase [Anaerolineae bacterium]
MPAHDSHSGLGKDRYAAKYRDDVELQAQWLNFGAIEKTNSIQILLERNAIKPHTLLELGCGTGAILQECKRRGLAEAYSGIDYSEDAIAYLKTHVPNVTAYAADIMKDDLLVEDVFDVVIISHVLEHLEAPHDLLTSLLSKLKFTYLIAEVPLEDLPLLRIRSRLWGRPGEQAGHVQVYTQRSFEALLTASGFEIIDRRQYLPIPTRESLELVRLRNNESDSVHQRRLLGRHLQLSLNPLWRRLYYAHHACLCIRADHTDTSAR